MAPIELTLVDQVLIPTTILTQYESEVTAVLACKTIGDVKRVEPTLGVIGLPGMSLEEMEDEELYLHPETGEWADLVDDGPWDATKVDGDYSWPPELETISMSVLKADLVEALLEAGAATYEEAPGPLDWFVVPEAETERAIEIAERFGYAVRRA